LFARQLKVTNYDLANLVNTAISEEVLPGKAEVSLIDRLIQEELDESATLQNEQSAPPSVESTPHAPIHAGELEDPASWFSDEAETARISSLPSAPARSQSPKAKTGWHETGVEYASQLLADDALGNAVTEELSPAKLDVSSPRPSGPLPAALLGPKSVPVVAKAAAKSGNGKYVVMGMALLAVLAIAIALLGKSL
jgi:hypothetical protein